MGFLRFQKNVSRVEIFSRWRQSGARDAKFSGKISARLVLDADLQSFIRSSISSTWALELLLLLRKNAPRAYVQEQLVLELRATPTLVSGCVEQLQKAGVVACEGGNCRYAPAAPPLEDLCAQLARAYEERPVAVINAIMASPHDRLRSFADAFRFTKKED